MQSTQNFMSIISFQYHSFMDVSTKEIPRDKARKHSPEGISLKKTISLLCQVVIPACDVKISTFREVYTDLVFMK